MTNHSPPDTRTYVDRPFDPALHGPHTKSREGGCTRSGCDREALVSRHWGDALCDIGDGWWGAYCLEHAWTSRPEVSL